MHVNAEHPLPFDWLKDHYFVTGFVTRERIEVLEIDATGIDELRCEWRAVFRNYTTGTACTSGGSTTHISAPRRRSARSARARAGVVIASRSRE